MKEEGKSDISKIIISFFTMIVTFFISIFAFLWGKSKKKEINNSQKVESKEVHITESDVISNENDKDSPVSINSVNLQNKSDTIQHIEEPESNKNDIADHESNPDYINHEVAQKGQQIEIHSMNNISKPQTHIIFSTSIELDIRGSISQVETIFDLVPIVRDLLFESLKQKVNIVSFITGNGNETTVPVLRPLVFLTAKRLGFNSYIKLANKAIIYVDLSSFCEDENDLDESSELIKLTASKNETQSSKENINESISASNKSIIRQKNEIQNEESEVFDNEYDYDNDYDYDKIDFNTDNDDYNADNFYESENSSEKVNETADNPYYQGDAFRAVQREFPLMPSICAKIICNGRNEQEAVEYAESFEDALKEGNPYICSLINSKQSTVKYLSKRNLDDALQVFNVESAIGKEKREEGKPRLIHSIEVDLSRANSEDASKSVFELIEALKKFDFSELVLDFSMNPKGGCDIENLIESIKSKHSDENTKIKQIAEKRENKFRFAVFNDKYGSF